jgi:hypothetical protein
MDPELPLDPLNCNRSFDQDKHPAHLTMRWSLYITIAIVLFIFFIISIQPVLDTASGLSFILSLPVVGESDDQHNKASSAKGDTGELIPQTGTEVLSSTILTCNPNSTSGNNNLTHVSDCIFDLASFAWLPTPCADEILTSQFLAQRSWIWYHDAGGQSPAHVEDVMAGKHDNLYVSAEYHVLHCTFMWRKLHRALLSGAPIDGYIGNYGHTEHCEKMILAAMNGSSEAQFGKDKINTIIRTKWPDCPIP